MKKILFSLAFVAFLCVSCSKGDASSASASEADTTAVAADTTAAPSGIPSIPRDAQAATSSTLKTYLSNLLSSVKYDGMGHTSVSNQRNLANKYCTASFQSRAAKSISYELNVFGPNWSDFCSDGSEQVRHVKFTVPDVPDEGTSQNVKVKISYDTYYDNFEGSVTKDGHNNETYTFKMVKEDNGWKVNDVIVNGRSLCKGWEYLP